MFLLTVWRAAIIVGCAFILGIDGVRLAKYYYFTKRTGGHMRRAVVCHSTGDILLAITTMLVYVQREAARSPFYWPIIPMTAILCLWLAGEWKRREK